MSSALPWYRQFWPWFLLALPASVVIASLYTVFLANQYADDLVVDDYYKEGLAINRELKRQSTAEQLGISAHVSAHGRDIRAQVSGTTDEVLRLRLSHPMEAGRDVAIVLTRVSPGVYEGQLPSAMSGQWHWTLDTGDGSPWRVDGDQHL